ncbi:MAG TPA: glycosyltransferase [Candidatus Acidoferrales bacterium]|nr:glycosyltransferase [Candidatus Acidoferrales bacterium]
MPTYNTPIEVLDLAIASVVRQRYRNWELCVCDDGSSLPAVAERLDDWRKADSRIRVAYSERNEGISGASNRALRMAKGEFVGLLDHDDELTPDALLEVVSHLQRWPNADMVYSDEDRLDLSGRRTQPFLKPDWSPENLLCMMYTCHFGVYRKRVLDEIGGFRLGFEGAQDYDLVLRLAERTQNIHHIPKILYHWRMLPTSMAAQGANAKPYAFRAARKALNEHFVRRGISAEAAPGKWAGLYRVRFKLDGSDRVSIILPVAGDLGKVLTTVSNIRERTAYSNYEVVVVPCVALSPEQRQILLSMSCRIVGGPEAGGPIGLTNLGVSKAEGDFVLLLTDGAIEIAFRGWLDSMLGFCGMKDVGGVGAKLLASDRRIQHVGIVLGLGGLAGYPLRGMHQAPEHCPGPDPTFLIRNCSAVSSACMMVRKHVFQAVRGFDERLGFGYADVDLCMRIRDAGYRIVWTPDAELIVDGSLAAMTNDGAGAEYLRRKWQRVSQEDPYYNPNLTLQHEDLGFRA